MTPQNPLFNHSLVSDEDFVAFFNELLRKEGCEDEVSIYGRLEYQNESTQEKVVYRIQSKSPKDYEIFFCVRMQGLNTFRQGILRRMQRFMDEYLLSEVRIGPGSNVLDCGANIGELGLVLRYFNYDFPYWGVDPGPLEFEMMKLNNRIINGKVFNLAFNNRDGDIKLYYKPDFGDSSLEPINDYADILKTKCLTLDTFLSLNALQSAPIGLLKLEAEGSELEVLQGAEKSLHLFQYITADLGFERGAEQTSPFAVVTNFLFARDFEAKSLHRVRKTFLYGRRD
jgi:FkbM family methyltransferase